MPYSLDFLLRNDFMEQPPSSNAPSYRINSTLPPRNVQRIHPLVNRADEEAICMPARITAFLTWGRRSRLLLFSSLFVLLFISIGNSLAQTTSRSSGWVFLAVDEYRPLHARAYPIEREPEPPPVEATLTRVDYDLRIDGELASGRASLTVDVLRDGWVRVPIPAGLLVREARLDGKLVLLVSASGKGA